MIDFSPPAERIPYDGSGLFGHRLAEGTTRLLDMYRGEVARAACMAQTYRRAIQLIQEWADGSGHVYDVSEPADEIQKILNIQAAGLDTYVRQLVREAVQVAKITAPQIHGRRGQEFVALARNMGRDAARGRLTL